MTKFKWGGEAGLINRDETFYARLLKFIKLILF